MNWNDWKWQLQNRIETVEELEKYICLSDEERRGIAEAGEKYRFSITPYYARLMDPEDPRCPLRRQMIPSLEELDDPHGVPDPMEEQQHSPVPAVVHLYPDRIALTANNVCATYCRYCFRKYLVGDANRSIGRADLEKAIEYVRQTPEIRDVLITGGDPLLFSDQKLDGLLSSLRDIPHVEIIRIGSRLPCVLPMRITPELCTILDKYHPIWLNTHFNHPKEITPEAAEACEKLLEAGVPIGNQAVLLRGINDDPVVMKKLCHELVKIRVRPYYLFHCHPVQGTEHLRTPVEAGLDIMEQLDGHTSGLAVPEYLMDTPHGKVPLTSPHILGRDGDTVVVRTWNGKIWRETNPLNGWDREEMKAWTTP